MNVGACREQSGFVGPRLRPGASSLLLLSKAARGRESAPGSVDSRGWEFYAAHVARSLAYRQRKSFCNIESKEQVSYHNDTRRCPKTWKPTKTPPRIGWRSTLRQSGPIYPSAVEQHSLADVVQDLRAELTKAIEAGEGSDLRFALGEIELELAVVVSKEGGGGGKLRFWVLEFGADGKVSAEHTQRITLKLTPTVRGQSGPVLIEGEAVPDEGTGS